MSKDSSDLVVIASVPSEIEATEILAAMKNLGIPAVLSGEFTSGFKAAATGDVKVLVKRSDAKRATQAIQEMSGRGDDIDWSDVDVGEPDDIEALGSYYSTILPGALLGILVAVVVPVAFQRSDLDVLYRSNGFWGAVVFCALTAALYTAKATFALGKRSRVDKPVGRMKEDDH